jgi:hypothetical protein
MASYSSTSPAEPAFMQHGLTSLATYDYALLADGTVMTVHATLANSVIVGDTAYAPAEHGTYLINGVRYARTHGRNPEAHTPRRDPAATKRAAGWSSVAAKSIVNRHNVLAVAQPHRLLERRLEGPLQESLARSMDWISTTLVAPTESVAYGLIGSVGLADDDCPSLTMPHDFDIVIEGSIETLKQIVSRSQQIVLAHPTLRVHEYGKGWNIRIELPFGLLCMFFRANPSPLDLLDWGNLRMRQDQVDVSGTVVDVARASLTPCVIEIADARLGRIAVVLPSLRTRGDVTLGTTLKAQGKLYAQTGTDLTARRFVLVQDERSAVIEPAPWPGYYSD